MFSGQDADERVILQFTRFGSHILQLSPPVILCKFCLIVPLFQSVESVVRARNEW